MDLDDYGELIRFWLQVRTGEEGSITTKLADELHINRSEVGHWLRGARNIPDRHWRHIATHFHIPRATDHALDDLIADARRLWAVPEYRRYYKTVKRKRKAAA